MLKKSLFFSKNPRILLRFNSSLYKAGKHKRPSNLKMSHAKNHFLKIRETFFPYQCSRQEVEVRAEPQKKNVPRKEHPGRNPPG